MKIKYCILYLSVLTLVSCFKKEKPISLPAGTSEVTSLFIGQNYENVLYFDLGTNKYQQSKLADWDICFDASKNGWGVYMNSGTNLILKNSGLYNLNETQLFDTSGYVKKLDTLTDSPDGHPEGTGVGKWQDKYTPAGPGKKAFVIFVLYLPYLQGSARYKRLQFLAVNDTSYLFKVTELYNNGAPVLSNDDTIEIKKNANYNFIYYSFKNGGNVVQGAEPDRNSWDIEFTRYKEILPIVGPYPVNGVLSNMNNVTVAKDSMTSFNDIDGSKVPTYQFTTNRNGIGYDWKTYDMNAGAYIVNSKVTYIIKDTDGEYYKLRFLDFYNDLKQKGYPKFEFMRIK